MQVIDEMNHHIRNDRRPSPSLADHPACRRGSPGYDLPDAAGSAVRAEMKRIKPEVPVLLFAGVGNQTQFLLRFFDAHLTDADTPEWALHDSDG